MLDAFLENIFRHPRVSAMFAGAFVIIVAVLLWWQFIWQSPERVFTDMLANNLNAASVTKHASATNSTQSIDQYVTLQMGASDMAEWVVTARQNNTTIATDSIGTPTSGYLRYTRITAGQRNASSLLNFSSVLNVWGKSDGKTDTSLNDLFSQSLLDISIAPLPPIGNLPSTERSTLLAYMRTNHVFSPTYSTVKREVIQGHHVYTYHVAVPLGTYIEMMQLFARDLGLTSLNTVDPSQYASAAPVTIVLSVDKESHELVQAVYPQTGFTQTYGSWGIVSPIRLPTHTISTTELQQRLQTIAATHP